MTVGYWGNDRYIDETLNWYNPERPSASIMNYLESNPQNINFDWIDPKRVPYIVAVRKTDGQILVVDKYSNKNTTGFSFITKDENRITYYLGIRDINGEQV